MLVGFLGAMCVLLTLALCYALIRLTELTKLLNEATATLLEALPEEPKVKAQAIAQAARVAKAPPPGGFRSHVVRHDGSIEFSDGEIVEPDRTKVDPPAMKMA